MASAEKHNIDLSSAPENIGSSAILWPVPMVYGLIGERPKPIVIAATDIPTASIKSPPMAIAKMAPIGTRAILFS